MSLHCHMARRQYQTKIYETINASGGIDEFKFEILKTFTDLTKTELRKKENEFIKLFEPVMNTNKAYLSEEEKKANNNATVKRFRENHKDYVEKCKQKSKEFRLKHPTYMSDYYKKRKIEKE